MLNGREFERLFQRKNKFKKKRIVPAHPHPHTHTDTMGSVLDGVFLSLPSGIWGPAPCLVHSVAGPWLEDQCSRLRGWIWLWLWRLQRLLRPRMEACKGRRTTCRHYKANTAPSEFQAGFHASLIQGGMKLT